MTIDSPALERARRSLHRRVILVGGVVPVAIAVAVTVAMLSWLPELPDPIATHWSGAGPDGFGPAVTLVFVPLAITVLFSLFAIGTALGTTSVGLAWTQKVLLIMSIWLSGLLSVGIGWSVAVQRGIKDASEAPDPGLALLLGAIGGAALAAVAWFLLPKTDATREQGETPDPAHIAETERVSWSRTVTIAPVVVVVIGVAVVATTGAAIIAIAVASAGAWIAVASLALVMLLASATSFWRVTADRRGLLVRSALGWPRIRIATADIVSVQVVDINPTADFGGWGYRWAGHGRSGIIMRAGTAIEVTHGTGKRFVVTVDDARTGASVLAGLIAQHRSPVAE
jgi:hypothetical protein